MEDMKQDLINRLNGIYVAKVDDGAGLLNGKDTFTREFPVPPICKEAATVIAAQEAEIKRLRSIIEKLPTESYNAGVAVGILKDKADYCFNEELKNEFLKRMVSWQDKFKELHKAALKKTEE